MKHYLLSLLLLLFSGTSYAQLVAWNFGPATRGDEKTSVSTFADPCMEASELSRGPGHSGQLIRLPGSGRGAIPC